MIDPNVKWDVWTTIFTDDSSESNDLIPRSDQSSVYGNVGRDNYTYTKLP